MSDLVEPSFLTADKSYDIYRRLMEQGDQMFLRAALLGLLAVSAKFLGLDIGDLSAGGAKLIIANPKFITGALGWLTLFFFLSALVKVQEASKFSQGCTNIIDATKFESGDVKHPVTLLYLVLVLFLTVTTLLAIATSMMDMIELVSAAFQRIAGLQPHIGPFDICISK